MRTIPRSLLCLYALPVLLGACASDRARHKPIPEPVRPPLASVTSAEDGLELARSLREAGAGREALSALARLHRRYPDNTAILAAYARHAVAMEQDTLARRLLRKAMDANPGDWRTLSARAVLERRQGRYEQARDLLVRARHLSDGNPAVLNNLGMDYLLNGEARQAGALFRQALLNPDLKPSHAARIRHNLAVALAVTGDFDTADRLAGRQMPRHLKDARSTTIASFMGVSARRATNPEGWTARLADASAVRSDPVW